MVPCGKVSVRSPEAKEKIEVSCYNLTEEGFRKETGSAELFEKCG